MIIYVSGLLVVGAAISWSLWKAPSDTDLWGKDLDE